MKNTMQFVKIQFLLALFLSGTLLAGGLFTDRYPSARFAAMGGSGVAVSNDVWAGFYNPAGLSQLRYWQAGSAYNRLFSANFLTNIFGAATLPLPGRYGTLGLGVEYFGVDYDGQSIAGEYTLRFSHGFYLLKDIHSSLAVGYSLNVFHWTLGTSPTYGNLGSATTIGVDVGFLATIYGRTSVGITVTNINTPQLGSLTPVDLPQRVVAGIAYQPYEGVVTSLDLNRQIGSDVTEMWAGGEFSPTSFLKIRLGATRNPNRFTAGFGIHYRYFQLDYALVTHSELGLSHMLNIMVWKKQ